MPELSNPDDNIDFLLFEVRIVRANLDLEFLPNPVAYQELMAVKKEDHFYQNVLARMP